MFYFLGEFVGTALFVMLGCSVIANVTLKKSGMYGGGSLHIALGWGFALFVAAFIFGARTGGHFNPAVSLAMAVKGTLSWAVFPIYVIAQLLGAFVGAVLVYILFKDHMDQEENKETVLGVYATSPSIPNVFRNTVSEAVGTFVLVFGILGIGNVFNASSNGFNYAIVYALLSTVGTSLGGLTGGSVNPARDLGPRIAHALLPMKGKVDSNFGYGLIAPIIGPFIGAVIAVLLFGTFGF